MRRPSAQADGAGCDSRVGPSAGILASGDRTMTLALCAALRAPMVRAFAGSERVVDPLRGVVLIDLDPEIGNGFRRRLHSEIDGLAEDFDLAARRELHDSQPFDAE